MKTASEAIADNYKVFAEAFHKGDADAISQMYTADAQLLVPQAPVISGPPAIAEVWRRIVGTGGSSVRVTTAEVQENGDWMRTVNNSLDYSRTVDTGWRPSSTIYPAVLSYFTLIHASRY